MKTDLLKNKTVWTYILVAAILIGFFRYAVAYIDSTKITVDGKSYYILFDDAMISMRYARNLANGYGLVWNPGGERVEGFTNLLWVLYMAIFHLFPIPANLTSLYIQVSGAIFMAISIFLTSKLAAEVTDSMLARLGAVFLTAFYAPLSIWSLLGMEVSLLLVMITFSVWQALRTLRTGKFSPWLYWILAIGTLVRVDMAVPYIVVLAFMLWFDPNNRRKHLIWGTILFALFLGGQTIFRYLYYGDVLPNTYYLKMIGVSKGLRIARGFLVYWTFLWNFNIVLFTIPFLLLLLRRDRPSLLLAAVFLAQSAYSIYVGGDAWEHRGGANRFIAIVMPLFFVLLAYSFESLRQGLITFYRRAGRFAPLASNLILAVFVVIALFSTNALLGTESWERWLLMKRPYFIAGNETTVRISLILDKITTPEASVAVTAAGNIPYLTERYTIDLLGKGDAYIAKLPMHAGSIEDYRPGHLKWDINYSVGELKPDVITSLWEGLSEEEQELILKDYLPVRLDRYELYLRKASPNIRWEVVDELD